MRWLIWKHKLHRKRRQQTSVKRIWGQTRLAVEDDQPGIVQEIKISPFSQMVCAQYEYVLENETHKVISDFEIKRIS